MFYYGIEVLCIDVFDWFVYFGGNCGECGNVVISEFDDNFFGVY